MTKLDREYYLARLDAERAAAAAAMSDEARAAHLELADHYTSLLAASDPSAAAGRPSVPPAANDSEMPGQA